jgi:hypothetical protein
VIYFSILNEVFFPGLEHHEELQAGKMMLLASFLTSYFTPSPNPVSRPAFMK